MGDEAGAEVLALAPEVVMVDCGTRPDPVTDAALTRTTAEGVGGQWPDSPEDAAVGVDDGGGGNPPVPRPEVAGDRSGRMDSVATAVGARPPQKCVASCTDRSWWGKEARIQKERAHQSAKAVSC